MRTGSTIPQEPEKNRGIYYAKYYGGEAGRMSAGGNIERFREKIKKDREEKSEKIALKNGVKGLEIASFWVIDSKKITRGDFCRPYKF